MTNYEYDQEIYSRGYCAACGVDEAGRGPLAGPVFAAAVILDPKREIKGLNDSKKLSEKKREALFQLIKEQALAYCIASATVEEIEELNILKATHLAMKRAVDGLIMKPDLAMIDGNSLPKDLTQPAMAIVKGDALSASIGAASILAKVSRDRLMCEIHEQYPCYQFSKHKGYGTPLHVQLLHEYGCCPVHRRSFLTKILG